jgi:ABC-type phosphate transport system substrate-binding protein
LQLKPAVAHGYRRFLFKLPANKRIFIMLKFTIRSACMAVVALTSVQSMAAVVGGGATMPANFYNDPAIRPATFAPYVGVGSGAGKAAFLNNDATRFGLSAGSPVHYAGSDSILSAAELSTYDATRKASWGPLIQIPAFATSITIPYKKSGTTTLNLTSAQLCQVFSGQVFTWGQLLGTTDSSPIKVIYRSGSSGTTEILTRHLNSQCPSFFSTNTTFTTANTGAEPANWIAVNSDQAIASTVAATEGAIGYAGPDSVDPRNNAVVARVNGLLPTVGNVATSLSAVAPPAGAARSNPANWAPVLANPATGYRLIGFTFLELSQCYRDAAVTAEVRSFLTKHYAARVGFNNDAVITAHNFIPLSAQWKVAVRVSFLNSNSLAIGDTNTCNGIGRP